MKPQPEVGQLWSYLDRRYSDYKYVTVLAVDEQFVHYRARGKRARRTKMALKRFMRHSGLRYCGHEGPGILPPFTTDTYVHGECLRDLRPTVLPLETELSVGIGLICVTRDDHPVWTTHGESRKRLAHMELRAREQGGDWRIRFDQPLSERTYQRQEGGWVLTSIGMGFA
jgi:hypothetical protein